MALTTKGMRKGAAKRTSGCKKLRPRDLNIPVQTNPRITRDMYTEDRNLPPGMKIPGRKQDLGVKKTLPGVKKTTPAVKKPNRGAQIAAKKKVFAAKRANKLANQKKLAARKRMLAKKKKMT